MNVMVANISDTTHNAQCLSKQWILELPGDVLKHIDTCVKPRLKLKSLEVGPEYQYFLIDLCEMHVYVEEIKDGCTSKTISRSSFIDYSSFHRASFNSQHLMWKNSKSSWFYMAEEGIED